MLILMGIPSEKPLQLLAKACSIKKIPFTFFNQRRQDGWEVKTDTICPDNSYLYNGEAGWQLAQCKGLYLRPMDYTQVPEYAGSSNREGIKTMYHQLYQLMNMRTSCRITNAPAVQLSNNSKPYQSLIIRQQGFDIPNMCITSDADEASDFLKKYPNAIYKSISGARSIVKQVDEQSLINLNKIKYCPVQFQECITGYNVRVHVVGRQAIATRICSTAVDYRYAAAEGKETTLKAWKLPESVAEKCVQLAHALHLPFAGIDLMFTKDGRTICFEVNPSPGYSYYEVHTGQRISYALADYLANGM